jgi:subtilisin family serine protease
MRLLAAAATLIALAIAPAAEAATDTLRHRQWNMSMVEIDGAHATASGKDTVVAVLDTGVLASHQDLQGRLVPGYDFVQNDADPQDGDGHGTHVLGIAGAATGNGIGIASVAPEAKLMPIRVLDDEGAGFADDAAKGIDFAIQHGADVINLSFGPEVPLAGAGGEFEQAVGRALDRGLVVVAAAGNSSLPVCEQGVGEGRLLCVGAVDKRRNRSVYSSFGAGLAISAPGGSALPVVDEGILSTYNNGGYVEVDGTSQAAPHVAGVAALVISKGLAGQAAVQRVLQTATDAGQPGPDPEFGAGIVNARRAVAGLNGGSAGRGGAGAGRGRAGSAARVSMRRRQRIRTVLKRGLRVRCLATGRGRCRVVARRKRTQVARGSKAVRLGRSAVVVARPTKRGKRLLKRALRRRKRVALRVSVALPGARVARRVTLVP